jgi:hypothetical protein
MGYTMLALPLEIIIRIAENDWQAWAKLALADPVFCKWAADPVQIARFMRTFIVKNDRGAFEILELPGTTYTSWFDYPCMFDVSYDNRRSWRRSSNYYRSVSDINRSWYQPVYLIIRNDDSVGYNDMTVDTSMRSVRWPGICNETVTIIKIYDNGHRYIEYFDKTIVLRADSVCMIHK